MKGVWAMGPNPDKARPNPDIPGLVYIKNTIKNPNIIVGDYESKGCEVKALAEYIA